MDSICDKLFVYGTLVSSFCSPESIRIKKTNRLLGNAYITGLLFEIGGYPGAIYDPGTGNIIMGELYQIRNVQTTFRWLDKYEAASLEFDPDFEYQRIQVPVFYRERILKAWMYQYSKPTNELLKIISGNYLTHLYK